MACRSPQIIRLILSIGFSLLAASCNHSSSCKIDCSQFREGDIILRKGRGLISDLIVSSLKDTLPYSHCGILVSEKNEWKVIHSIARELSDVDGVQICSLNRFLADCDKQCYMIVRSRSATAGLQIAKSARYYVGQNIPFDYQFNLADSSAFYCSELPIHILKYHCKIPINYSDKRIPFSLFTDTTYFRVITTHRD